MVLQGNAAQSELTVARVDGPKVTLQNTGSQERVIRARQARVVVDDQHTSFVTWQIDKRWALETTDTGWNGTCGDLTLICKLDPRWSWTIGDGNPDSTTITGTGSMPEDGNPIRSSFEIR